MSSANKMKNFYFHLNFIDTQLDVLVFKLSFEYERNQFFNFEKFIVKPLSIDHVSEIFFFFIFDEDFMGCMCVM